MRPLAALILSASIAWAAPARAEQRLLLGGRWQIDVPEEWELAPTRRSAPRVRVGRADGLLEVELFETLVRAPVDDKTLRELLAAEGAAAGSVRVEDAHLPGGRLARVVADAEGAQRWLALLPHSDGWLVAVLLRTIPNQEPWVARARAALESLRPQDAPLPCLVESWEPADGVLVRAPSGAGLVRCEGAPSGRWIDVPGVSLAEVELEVWREVAAAASPPIEEPPAEARLVSGKRAPALLTFEETYTCPDRFVTVGLAVEGESARVRGALAALREHVEIPADCAAPTEAPRDRRWPWGVVAVGVAVGAAALMIKRLRSRAR